MNQSNTHLNLGAHTVRAGSQAKPYTCPTCGQAVPAPIPVPQMVSIRVQQCCVRCGGSGLIPSPPGITDTAMQPCNWCSGRGWV